MEVEFYATPEKVRALLSGYLMEEVRRNAENNLKLLLLISSLFMSILLVTFSLAWNTKMVTFIAICLAIIMLTRIIIYLVKRQHMIKRILKLRSPISGSFSINHLETTLLINEIETRCATKELTIHTYGTRFFILQNLSNNLLMPVPVGLLNKPELDQVITEINFHLA